MKSPDNKPRNAGRLPFLPVVVCLSAALVAAMIYSSTAGAFETSAGDAVRSILAKVTDDTGWLAGVDETVPSVVVDVRLPRIMCAIFVGAVLAMAGVLMQGVLLNPLAEPYTLGVSAGAAFGAALAIVTGITLYGAYPVAAFAFVGAVVALGMVMLLATFDGQIAPVNLILSGVIVAAILAAGIGFLKYLADEKVSLIVFWLMGSFSQATWPQVLMAGGGVILSLAGGLFYARELDLLALGARSAHSLGVNTAKVRLIVLVLASLMTAACVSISGIIAFVGLIIPHFMRFLLGPGHGKLIPATALAGALLLLLADTITRALLPYEVPIGVLTSLIGGPVFCIIFRSRAMAAARLDG
ncbi:MAG: iron ABC transporter permease [Planctomycetes bacterium]|nr:iron ABC transporter permease [Planctomycetota bacterium]